MGVPVPLFSFLLEHTLQHPCRGLIRALEEVAVYVGRGAGPCVSGAACADLTVDPDEDGAAEKVLEFFLENC